MCMFGASGDARWAVGIRRRGDLGHPSGHRSRLYRDRHPIRQAPRPCPNRFVQLRAHHGPANFRLNFGRWWPRRVAQVELPRRSVHSMPMSDLGVAVFGAGRAGHSHARAIEQTADVRLVAVYDADRDRADSFAEQHGCEAFTNSDAVLARQDVELVMVALPNFLHATAATEAASAGKHVFLEKPMADTPEQCDAIIAAAERAGIHLLVAHSQRYFTATVRAREIIQNGQ